MSSGEAVGNLPRPSGMRGLLHKQIGKNLVIAFVTLTAAGLYMRFIYGDGNKRAYKQFYDNYDIEKEFERMRKKGLFDSCNAD